MNVRKLVALSGVMALCALFPCAGARAQNAAAPTYKIDPASSRVYIKVDKASRLGHEHGVEGVLSMGMLSMDGRGVMVFDMKSFTADTLQARQYVGLNGGSNDGDKVTTNMRGPDCLDVPRYPTAMFAISSIKPTDGQAMGAPGNYELAGKFTLHGVTRPVALQGKLENTTQAGTLHLTGAFSILQTDYGIRPYSALGGLARIADGLGIYGNFYLVPAK